MLKENKRASIGSRTFYLWIFFMFILIAVVISAGTYIFYSKEVDIRGAEAEILSNKIESCIVQEGILVKSFLNENFDIQKECDLDIQDSYYLKVSIYSSIANIDESSESRLITPEILANIMEHSKNKGIVKRKCNCGDECREYANAIIEAAKKEDISPLLLLSIMMQESSCDASASSGSSIGLMQINTIHCGKYSLPEDEKECIEELKSNYQKNIFVGAEILREYYEKYSSGKLFQGCTGRNIEYSGWEAAIRAYNGWGCGRDKEGNPITEQDYYVDEVIERYNEIKELAADYLENKEGSTTGKLIKEIKTGVVSFEKECAILKKKVKNKNFPACKEKLERVLYYENGKLKEAFMEILTASNEKGGRCIKC